MWRFVFPPPPSSVTCYLNDPLSKSKKWQISVIIPPSDVTSKQWPTCVVDGTEKLVDEFVSVFEASERGHGRHDVIVDTASFRNDVSLNDLHHRSLKLQLALATGCGPRMLVNLF